MKIFSALLLASLLALVAGCQAPTNPNADWEYKTVVRPDTTAQGKTADQVIEEFTAQGWTVVRFIPNPENPQEEWKFYLKRPIK